MTDVLPVRPGRTEVAPAFDAVRVRLGLVALLFALALVGWWWTARAMDGMDEGPWTPLGSLAWFVGVWVVMMAAMMLPSLAPTVALYGRMTRTNRPYAPLAFTAGYLLVWTATGVVAFALATLAGAVGGDALAWDRAGRPLAVGTLLLAAAYELTPLKNVCLGKCRSPLGFLLGAWRDGWRGAVGMGARLGAWCVGCCWALMAGLFALGVMNLSWMALLAALIAIEKTLPWRRVATGATALVLVALGVLLLVQPDALPGMSPSSGDPMPAEMSTG